MTYTADGVSTQHTTGGPARFFAPLLWYTLLTIVMVTPILVMLQRACLEKFDKH